MALTRTQASAALPAWRYLLGRMHLTVDAGSFTAALSLVNEVARIAEEWRREGLLAEGVRDAEVGAAGYAVFLVAAGLGEFPEEVGGAVRSVTARGLARALAAGGGAA